MILHDGQVEGERGHFASATGHPNQAKAISNRNPDIHAISATSVSLLNIRLSDLVHKLFNLRNCLMDHPRQVDTFRLASGLYSA